MLGAGHNGLAAACVLAREGFKTLVLEGRELSGGLCAGEAFHPGYRHVGLHHDSDQVRPALVAALQLASHGLALAAPPPVLLPAAPGSASPAVVLGEGPDQDLERLDAFVARVRPLVARLMDGPAPELGSDAAAWPLVQHAMAFRRLGGEAMVDLMRVGALSAEDWLSEHVADRRIRAGLALPALIGSYMGPRSPHSASLVLLQRALAGEEVVGGPAQLVDALARACKHLGATILLGQQIAGLRVERGQVKAVVLRHGGEIAAPIVVSTLDPRRTLLDLVPPRELPVGTEDEARAIRVRATSAKLHLALSTVPRFPSREGTFSRFRVAPDPNAIERAFDDCKHRRMPSAPALDVRIPSVGDTTLAPPGHHVLSAHVFGVPYEVAGGWTASAREQLLERTLRVLGSVAPGLPDSVVAAELLLPPELEARYGVSGGHPMHGETALDQLWVGRPGPTLSGHRTPIRGLFLGSCGTHPGGGVSGMSGLLAGRVAAESA